MESEEKKIADILKPRWKVIATFPDNSNYQLGSILDRDWCRYVNDEDESEGVIWRISDFPHLFRKLDWWEEREEKDMPEYVKTHRGEIIKPKHFTNSWGQSNTKGCSYNDEYYGYYKCKPATENEYNEQNKAASS